ncbi:MAG: hypothetical protein CM1200mP35_09890 [Chloroflexota bacterium]|nr:MAG: hypothetical protein CM1200mP35_09890 [Chloroflexota bacterium]
MAGSDQASPGYRRKVGPIWLWVSSGDLEAIERFWEKNTDIAGIILEPTEPTTDNCLLIHYILKGSKRINFGKRGSTNFRRGSYWVSGSPGGAQSLYDVGPI